MTYQLIKRYYDNNNNLEGEEIVIESDDELWIYDQKDFLTKNTFDEYCDYVVRKVAEE